MNPVIGVVTITWEINFLMLDFDKMEVILTFNYILEDKCQDIQLFS